MAHIRTEYGEEGFHELIRQMAAGLPADAAIRMATGRPMTEVDRDWRNRLESRPLWLQAVVNDTSLLAMTGLLFAFGFWSFRKRKKAVLARWAEEEAARDLVYDRVVRYWENEEPIIMDAATDDRPTTIESGAEETEVH